MADGKKKMPPALQEMIQGLGSFAETAHIFYRGMKGAGASENEALAAMEAFIQAFWHESMQDAREKRNRDGEAT